LIDVGVDAEIIRKSGAWYTYEGDQLGQGKENARQFLMEHQDIAQEIERRIRESLGLTSFGEGESEVVQIGEPEGEPAGAPAG
jgi:recombination protein RecA